MKSFLSRKNIAVFIVLLLILLAAGLFVGNRYKADALGNIKVKQVEAKDGLLLTRSLDGPIIPGKVLTYKIHYKFLAGKKDAKISEDIPEGLYYLSDSARLNNKPVTDIADEDKYELSQNKASFNLGKIGFGGSGLISFQLLVPNTIKSLGCGKTSNQDDTDVLQCAIDRAVADTNDLKALYIPASPKPYIVRPLSLKTNTRLLLGHGTVIQAVGGYGQTDSLLNIKSQDNITVIGYGASVSVPKQAYLDGSQWRHGVNILSSKNITIKGLKSDNNGGDGYYLGIDKESKRDYNDNIKIIDCSADQNFRQGLSIISAQNVLVKHSTFTNASGQDPQSGIDIEPNSPTNRLSNINIEDSKTSGNGNFGIVISLKHLANASCPNKTCPKLSVNVVRHNDSDTGSISYAVMGDDSADLEAGNITFKDCKSINAQQWGARITSLGKIAPLVWFDSLEVQNANLSGTKANGDISAILAQNIAPNAEKTNQVLANIYFRNTKISDTKTDLTKKIDHYFNIQNLSFDHRKTNEELFSNIKFIGAPALFTGAKDQSGLLQGEEVVMVNIP